MATIKRIESKKGAITYKITVSHGIDEKGRQVRRYLTWTAPQGMTERQAAKAAEKEAEKFEQLIKSGFRPDIKVTFAEYSKHVVMHKKSKGKKEKTIEQYEYLLQRITPILGHYRITEITPMLLNDFYAKMQQSGLRDNAARGKAIDPQSLKELIKAKKFTQKQLAEKAGFSISTVTTILAGKMANEDSINKFCSALDINAESNFLIIRDVSPLSNRVIFDMHRLLHTILEQAVREQLIIYNPCNSAEPPETERHEANCFQPNQIMDLLDALQQEPLKWQAILSLLIYTGCRRGEIAALKWGSIDEKNCTIRVDATLEYSAGIGTYENSTKTGNARTVTIPQETMDLLLLYKQQTEAVKKASGNLWTETNYCFVQANGKPINPNSITAYCRNLSKRYNLKHLNPHALRHSAASAMINSGVDILTVSKRLGHAKTSITLNVYGHLISNADKDACDITKNAYSRKQA